MPGLNGAESDGESWRITDAAHSTRSRPLSALDGKVAPPGPWGDLGSARFDGPSPPFAPAAVGTPARFGPRRRHAVSGAAPAECGGRELRRGGRRAPSEADASGRMVGAPLGNALPGVIRC